MLQSPWEALLGLLTHRLDFLEHHVIIGPESPGSSGWRVTHTHTYRHLYKIPQLSLHFYQSLIPTEMFILYFVAVAASSD